VEPHSRREAEQARTDFALLESHLETIAGQIARVPTRAFLCRILLLATASIWALLAVVLLKMG
jgi:hypothetical protein